MSTIESLKMKKVNGEKISCLTAYDASFASLFYSAGVDILLVGDSLGMVVQGKETTIPVTLEEVIYHAQCVKRGAPEAFIIVDLPFSSYFSVETALESAAQVLKQSGAQVVKLEGGKNRLPVVAALAEQGIPVCGHLGLLPQSVHKKSGYRVQGKSEVDADAIYQDALGLEQAGADFLVLECVPASLAARISQALSIPVIGIGAGSGCDGQVLVSYDMLALTKGKRPKFSRDFMQGSDSIEAAVKTFIADVKQGVFPGEEHSF